MTLDKKERHSKQKFLPGSIQRMGVGKLNVETVDLKKWKEYLFLAPTCLLSPTLQLTEAEPKRSSISQEL